MAIAATRSQLAEVLHCLYHDSEPARLAAANHWLVRFQTQRAAWQIAIDILSGGEGESSEVKVFAAQTLRRKVQKGLKELNVEDQCSLRQALQLLCRTYSSGPQQLLTQLCLALSALALRLEQWPKPVADLLTTFGGDPSLSRPMLELLTVLPEECLDETGSNAGVNSMRKRDYNLELLSCTDKVLEYLQRHLQGHPLHLQAGAMEQKKALMALLSWVRVGCFNVEMAGGTLEGHPLVLHTLGALRAEALFGTAVEVLAELVSRYEALPGALLSKIIAIRDTMLGPALAEGNELVVAGLCRVMSELGQTATALIAAASPDSLAICDSLISCIGMPAPDWEIAEISLPFWCKLADSMVVLHAKGSSKEALAALTSRYSALLRVLAERAQADAGEGKESSTAGLPEDLVYFRLHTEETLSSICHVLGPAEYLSQLLGGVENWLGPPPAIPWQALEARLYFLQAVVDVVNGSGANSELTPLLHLLACLPAVQQSFPRRAAALVHRTAAQVVAAYADWLANHQEALLPTLSFLAQGLSSVTSASACATALRRLTEEAPALAADQQALEGLIHVGERLHELPLSTSEEEDVLCAIGGVLSSLSAGPLWHHSLSRLLHPCHLALLALLEAPASFGPGDLHHPLVQAAVRALHRLGALCCYVRARNADGTEEAAAAFVLQAFWPTLQSLSSPPYTALESIAAATCRSLSQALRAAGTRLSSYLEPLMALLTQQYASQHANACYLKTATVALEEFGVNEHAGQLAVEALRVFSTAPATVQHAQRPGCDHQPDLVEAYFLFLTAYVRNCNPAAVAAAEPFLEVGFHRAVHCASANHRAVAVAALGFLAALLEVADSCSSESSSKAAGLVWRSGPVLLAGLLQALLGASPLSKVHKVTGILQQLAALCFHSNHNSAMVALRSWLEGAFHGIPPGVLQAGEAEVLVQAWGDALAAAAADHKASGNKKGGRAGAGGYMKGDGGRLLKRLVREFVDKHSASMVV